MTSKTTTTHSNNIESGGSNNNKEKQKSNKTKQQQQWKIVEKNKTGKTTVIQSQNTNETLGEFRRFP